MLKYNYYTKDFRDRAWFDSSNIVYAECDDSSNTQSKTVYVTFKNGLVYCYSDVNLFDWVSFKNSESQGKALNEYFKKDTITYTKLEEKVDVEALNEEYEFLSQDGCTIHIFDNSLTVTNKEGDEIYSILNPTEDSVEHIKGILQATNHFVKIIKEDEH